jgi:signal transduction histidine kinase
MKKYIFTRSLGFKFLAKVALSFFLAIAAAETYARLFSNPYIEYNRANMSLTIFNILVFGLFIVTCSTFVLVFLVLINKEIKYIKYIAKQVKFIANQSLGLTLEVRGNDELSELCANINSMSEELKDKFERERELEKTKNELITNVSHDLRTPLTSIIGYLDFLKNGTFKSEEEQKEYLNSAYNLSTKLKGLIDELFEYTKLSSNEVQLEFVNVNICAVLNQLLGEYGPILEKKELRIINNIPDNNLNVKVDIEKIVRVFENILNNAEKYSYKPSDIVVNVDKEEEYIIISFSNRGEHIPQEKIDKMFERFYRMDPSRSNNVPGSGLGLAISKKIIELHGGHIWAESNGDIITFKVKLQLDE